MSPLKNMFYTFIVFIGSFSLLSCSRHTSENQVPGALPESWHSLTLAQKASENEDVFVLPNPTTDAAVLAVFKTNTAAFSELELTPPPTLLDKGTKVPWHLDGLMADFALSADGVLGSLFSTNGTYAIKGIWRRADAPPLFRGLRQRAFRLLQKKSRLAIGAQTTSHDIANQLGPIIQSTMAAGLVESHSEEIFKINLLQQSEKFRILCQQLNSLRFTNSWHVNSFQVQLAFNTSGQITPLTSVGGSFNLFLDWQKSPEETPLSEMTKSNSEFSQFNQIIAAEISQAIAETPDLNKSGLILQQVQLGLALGGEGDIGIATVGAGIQGVVGFTRDTAATDVQNFNPTPVQNHERLIKLIGVTNSHNKTTIATVHRKKLRKGLKRALKMAYYFGEKAIHADTNKWKLFEIETELDISLSGDVAIATVNGGGIIVLDFDRQVLK